VTKDKIVCHSNVVDALSGFTGTILVTIMHLPYTAHVGQPSYYGMDSRSSISKDLEKRRNISTESNAHSLLSCLLHHRTFVQGMPSPVRACS
jgi:hypothetical protein